MSVRTLIGSTHPLSRLFCHPVLECAGKNVRSVEGGFWCVLLLQHRRNDLYEKLMNHPRLLSQPGDIANWAKQEGFTISPSWRYFTALLYYFVMSDQVKTPGSAFRTALITESQCRQPPGSPPHYIAITRRAEKIWTCGQREADDDDIFPGSNVYGELLDLLEFELRTDDFSDRWNVQTLFSTTVPIEQSPEKTVLIISDSQCRYISAIEEGKCVSISGGTYHHMGLMIDHLAAHGYRFDDYNFIIINCGVNDCQRSKWEQRRNWQDFKPKLLEITTNRPAGSILISPEFPHPEVPGARDHAKWIREELADTPVLCIDWDRRANPFVRRRRIIPKFFAIDGFHLSQAGFSQLWKIWCESLYELRFVNYELSRKPQSIKKDPRLW